MTHPTPHNFYLRLAAENGILGIFVSISFFVIFFPDSKFGTMRFTRNRDEEYYVLSFSSNHGNQEDGMFLQSLLLKLQALCLMDISLHRSAPFSFRYFLWCFQFIETLGRSCFKVPNLA